MISIVTLFTFTIANFVIRFIMKEVCSMSSNIDWGIVGTIVGTVFTIGLGLFAIFQTKRNADRSDEAMESLEETSKGIDKKVDVVKDIAELYKTNPLADPEKWKEIMTQLDLKIVKPIVESFKPEHRSAVEKTVKENVQSVYTSISTGACRSGMSTGSEALTPPIHISMETKPFEPPKSAGE
jgi:hypothetical protein